MACNNNIVVSANAGTGKTATMILKIEQELEKDKTYKCIGAITFTIKATNEIRSRLHKNISKVVVNTNNGFVFDEIINPFFKDYNRAGMGINLNTDYMQKFDTYEDGIKLILNDGTIGSYRDAKKNFIFELAINIIENSSACNRYLKAKYKMIFIDEYQDSDEKMHELFMKINKKLEIRMFIIGDIKQSIYMWKNANPKLLQNVIDDKNFCYYTLTNNFRSVESIQDYANLFMDETRKLVKLDSNIVRDVYFIIGADENTNFSKVLNYLDINDNFALLRFRGADAERYANMFNTNGIKCTYVPIIPIKEITTSSSWIYNNLVDYLLIKKVSEYDLINQIPGAIKENRNEFQYIKNLLKEIKNFYILCEKESLFLKIKEFGNYYGYEIRADHLEKLYESVTEEKYVNAIKLQNKDSVSITFHTSKGLQFNQVILFAEDYPLNNIDSLYNHYVASTRAKNKLIIICNKKNYNSKRYADSFNAIIKKTGFKNSQIFQIIETDINNT